MPRFRRYHEDGYPYFITTTVLDRRPLFQDARLSSILIDNPQFYRDRMKFALHGYVIMPDHVHLLLTPRHPHTISDVMRNFKSYTSREARRLLGVAGPLWQSRFYDRAVRDEAQFRSALEYIHLNPVRAGLVEADGAYEFSSSRFWGKGKGPLALDHPDGRGWGRDLQTVVRSAG